MGTLSLSTIVAFSPVGSGIVLVGLLNGGVEDGSSIDVWVGDISFVVEFADYPMLVFRKAASASALAGVLVGRQFGSWVELKNAWDALGSPIKIGEIE
jgi:hypothetical protein